MPLNIGILQKSARKVKRFLANVKPYCALILGSGWGEITEAFSVEKCLDYHDIECLAGPTVKGHSGHLILAEYAGLQLLIFQGRRHWYEGDGWEPVAFPVYLSIDFGAEVIVLTNAAGGIREDLKPGDLMIIDDHINMMGANPLMGSHDPAWGPRFPDQTEVYDKRLRELLDAAAQRAKEKISHGIYAAASGPTYETPAEVAMYRSMGADAVGMSTVPEAILANSVGLRVAAISCIANTAIDKHRRALSHDKVINAVQKTQPRMKALLTEFIRQLNEQELT